MLASGLPNVSFYHEMQPSRFTPSIIFSVVDEMQIICQKPVYTIYNL